MAVLKIQLYGGQFMLNLPQAYVHIYGIKPGDLFEVSRTKTGFLYKVIPKKDIVDKEFGRRKRTFKNQDAGGEAK